MNEGKITPEEKLLNIIENPSVKTKKFFLPARIVPGAAANTLPLLRSLFSQEKILKIITLRTATKLLIILCALVAIFSTYNYFFFRNELNRKYSKIISETGEYDMSTQKQVFPEVNMNDIIADYRAHNMFSFLPVVSTETGAVQKEISQLAANLKLVGVIWSENPQAMIEDNQDHKTYLVNKDEYVGTLRVNKILRNSVFLGKDKEEFELK